jgi:hypothetical protein
MTLARLTFGGIGVFVLVLLAVFGISGCDDDSKPKGAKGVTDDTVTIKCVDTVIVDKDGPNGVAKEHQVVYVCDGHQVKWKGTKGEMFKVEFDPSDCPFNPCPVIDNNNDHGQVKNYAVGDYLHLYKYKITVNGKESTDPHAVGGGR